jgi:hypothetical protein
MSGWIKWEKDLEDDPRVLRMARELKRICNASSFHYVTLVCGGLVRLWSYADAHIRDDDTLDLGCEELDEVIGIEGFCKLMPEDWLREVDEHTVELPNFQEHNGVEAKKRALTQKRVERFRNTKSVTPSVTEALPDQDQTKTKTSKKRDPKTKGAKSAIPSDFSLTDDLREYATKHLPNVDPPALFESFKGKALAKAWAYANWHQAFQEYVRNCAPNSGHWASGQYPKANGGIQWQ